MRRPLYAADCQGERLHAFYKRLAAIILDEDMDDLSGNLVAFSFFSADNDALFLLDVISARLSSHYQYPSALRVKVRGSSKDIDMQELFGTIVEQCGVCTAAPLFRPPAIKTTPAPPPSSSSSSPSPSAATPPQPPNMEEIFGKDAEKSPSEKRQAKTAKRCEYL